VALTLVLLTGAGLFIDSLRHARAVPLGFDAEQVISVSVDLHALGYRPADVLAKYEAMEDAVRSLPHVAATSLVSGTVFGFGQGTVVHIPGRDSMPLPQSGSPMISAVTPGYFQTLNTRIIRGRGLSEADRAGSPRVAVINQRFAAHYWPGEDPVGQCFRIMGDKRCTTVVGVSGNAALYDMMESGEDQFYVPMNQLNPSSDDWRSQVLLIRSDGDPGPLITAVRRAAQRSSPDLPFADISVVASRFDRALRPWQLGSILLGILGGLGLLLAAVGLYGVLSYLVSQRTQELGIRVALGADRRALLGMVVGQGIRVALVGVGIGIVGALAAGKTIAALLYGVSPTDPVVLGIVAAVVIVVSVTASYLPARRATQVDPMTALRYE
jgi:predicted permease